MKPVGAVALVALGFFAARHTGPAPAGDMAAEQGEPVATQVRYVEPSESGQIRIVLDETRQRELLGSLDDDRIKRVLLAAVRNPSDPGVRADSLDLLKQRSESDEVRDALLFALEHDPNDGVRLKALEGLRAYPPDAESRRVLSRVLLGDKNPGVRSLAIELLTRTAEVDVVETLQELLMREDNSYVRMRSQRALEQMNAPVETF
jgi:HEAT repeat protein